LVFLIHTELRCTVNHTSDLFMDSYVCGRSYMIFFALKVSPNIRDLYHSVKVKSVVVSRGQFFYRIESLTSVMKLIVTDR